METFGFGDQSINQSKQIYIAPCVASESEVMMIRHISGACQIIALQ